eukprot:g16372.t1
MSNPGNLVGDREQRVTVSLPRTLHELKSHAHRNFTTKRGSSKPMRMFHHGKVVITHPNHMSNLKDGDVVVLTANPEEQGPPPLSTHQAHYVPHPLQAKKPPPDQDGPKESVPFDGKTGVKTGRSTYASEYPWHNVKPPDKTCKHVPPGKAVPFEGLSSYQQDYVKHPQRPRSAAGRPKPQLPASGPFEGSTTYTTDYKRFQVPPARPVRMDGGNMSEPKPFEGSSEYRREYLKHPLNGRAAQFGEKSSVYFELLLRLLNYS